MTPMFSSLAFLHLRSNLIAYFLPFFKVFIYLFIGFSFDNLAPPHEHMFQKMF